MAVHNLGNSQLSFNLSKKGEQGGFNNGKLIFLSEMCVCLCICVCGLYKCGFHAFN